MKILATADWHSRDKDIQEIEKCLSFLVETAREEKPDLIIHSGDFFHSRDVRLDSQAAKLVVRVVSDLADIAPIAAVLGTPSHDGRAPEILSMVRGRYPVHVATQPEQILLLSGTLASFADLEDYQQPDLVITMIPQPTKEFWQGNGSIRQTDQEIAQAMSAVFMGFGGMAAQFSAPHILVMHGTAKGSKLCNGQNLIGKEIEVAREQIEMAQCDLAIFGHIHLPQEVFPRVFYSGSIYAVDIGEDGKHGFYIHEIGKQ